MTPFFAFFWRDLQATVRADDPAAAAEEIARAQGLSGMPTLHYARPEERAFALDVWSQMLDRGWIDPALALLKRINPDARAYLLTDVIARQPVPPMKQLLTSVKRLGGIPAAVQFEAACERGNEGAVEYLLRHAFSTSGLVAGLAICLKQGPEAMTERLWKEATERNLLKWQHVPPALNRPTLDWIERLLPHMHEPQMWGCLLSGLIGGTSPLKKQDTSAAPVAAHQPAASKRLLQQMLIQVCASIGTETPEQGQERKVRLDNAVARAIESKSPLLPTLLQGLPSDVRFLYAMEAALKKDADEVVPQLLPRTDVEALRQRWGRGPKPQWALLDKLSRWLPQEQAQAWATQHKNRLPQTLARLREASARAQGPACRRPRSRS